MQEKTDPLFVSSLAKGFKVLDAFYGKEQYLRFSDIVKLTGLSKGAVQRYVRTLEILGFLWKNPEKRHYCLTAKALDLTYSFLHSSPLIDIAIPHLLDLRNRCGETVNLSFLDGRELIYVFRAPGQRHTLNASVIGRRVPLYCTSGGRAMLSILPEKELQEILTTIDFKKITPYTETDREKIYQSIVQARADGFAIINQEVLLGEITVAAPIINPLHNGVAAVHVPVMAKNWSYEEVRKKLAPEVLEVAHNLSKTNLR